MIRTRIHFFSDCEAGVGTDLLGNVHNVNCGLCIAELQACGVDVTPWPMHIVNEPDAEYGEERETSLLFWIAAALLVSLALAIMLILSGPDRDAGDVSCSQNGKPCPDFVNESNSEGTKP